MTTYEGPTRGLSGGIGTSMDSVNKLDIGIHAILIYHPV